MLTEINKKIASEIIETREMLGKFFYKDGDKYIGIDNKTGDAWTAEFKSLEYCKRWLAYGIEEND